MSLELAGPESLFNVRAEKQAWITRSVLSKGPHVTAPSSLEVEHPFCSSGQMEKFEGINLDFVLGTSEELRDQRGTGSFKPL